MGGGRDEGTDCQVTSLASRATTSPRGAVERMTGWPRCGRQTDSEGKDEASGRSISSRIAGVSGGAWWKTGSLGRRGICLLALAACRSHARRHTAARYDSDAAKAWEAAARMPVAASGTRSRDGSLVWTGRCGRCRSHSNMRLFARVRRAGGGITTMIKTLDPRAMRCTSYFACDQGLGTSQSPCIFTLSISHGGSCQRLLPD